MSEDASHTTPAAPVHTDAEAAASRRSRTVHVDGLPEALQQAREGLGFVGTAGRFYVANLRMVLLRNALIALAVVAALVAVVTVCMREA